MDNNKKPIVIIAGPTACGKTAAAVSLALTLPGEIISADSMQIYKYMDIGTAKPTSEEMRGVKHHLISELFPDDEYSAAVFKQKAEERIESIYKNGKIPIIAGGTGFYINALLRGAEFSDKADTALRRELADYAARNGSAALHNMLREIDPDYADTVHENNVKKVIRAIEFHTQTGERLSGHNSAEKAKPAAYWHVMVIMERERGRLYETINKRADDMLRRGLVDEVKNLLDMGYGPELVSMSGIGYKETVKNIQGEWDYEKTADEIKKATRHFAKRQITWFKRQNDGVWLDADEFPPEKAAEKISALCKEAGII